ncbi:MAG: hypothetical protein HND52_18215 [Ignavibacteriae bacterium]|nr:hypothetical protein [Ignavibacteriota bacterium]NOG99898.1 hypothetical protein [Ignavibacteriota bacterium]
MTINIKTALKLGIRAVIKNRRVVILLWAFNVVAALILSMPIYYILDDSLRHSLLSADLYNTFQHIWFQQFLKSYSTNIGEIPFVFYSMVGFYVLIQTFFLGGLIAIFSSPKKNHMVDFFYGGVKYWLRFTRVLFISIIFFYLAFKFNDYTGDLIQWAYQNSDNALMEFIFRALRYVLLVFLIGIVTIISDYSKISLAVKDSYKSLREIFNTIIFLRKNFTKVFTVFLIVAVIGALGSIIYNLIGRYIPRTPYYYLFLLFIIQQMLIIFRLFVRMLFCSTEVILFKDLSAEVLNVKVTEQKVGV